jgi:phospholipase/carboxylesterase
MSAALDAYAHRFDPGTGEGRPLLLLLHGTGGDENDLIPLGRMLAPGAPIVSPRGNVPENGMRRFFRRFPDGTFDLEDLERRTHELADWVGAAVAAHAPERPPVVAVGFSNGANIAAAMLLRRPDVLAGAVLLRVTLPFEPDTVPDLPGRRIFMAEGRDDPYVRVPDAERLIAILEQAGAEVTVRWSGGGHGLNPADAGAAREWFARQTWR